MTFERIYRENAWGGTETRSGPGSGMAATEYVALDIMDLAAELKVETVIDAACGECLWMPDFPVYIGVDVSKTAIKAAKQNHPRRHFIAGDFRKIAPALEPADMVIMRDVLQHLPLVAGVEMIEAARNTGSTWLLASTFVGGENIDVEEGGAFSPDLSEFPFDLSTPRQMIFDGYDYANSAQARDLRKNLGLWRL